MDDKDKLIEKHKKEIDKLLEEIEFLKNKISRLEMAMHAPRSGLLWRNWLN